MIRSESISSKSLMIYSGIVIATVIVLYTVLSQGITLPGGVEANLGTEIKYSDSTTDTISSGLKLGSLIASKNTKPISTITYTPSITSKNPKEVIYVNYSIIATDQSKNVVFTKDANQQLTITGVTKNQRLPLQPLSATSSELLSGVTSAQNIDLMMIMTIDGRRLQSETITIEISNQQPAIGAQPYIPPPPPPLPAATTSGGYSTPQPTPVPTATQQYNDLQLRVVEISGSFS